MIYVTLGYTLPMRTPFIVSCIVSGFVGIYLSIFQVTGYAMGGMGIFLYPAYINPANGSFHSMIHLAIGTVIAFSASFAIMMTMKIPVLYGDVVKTKAPVTPAPVVPPAVVKEQMVKSPLTGQVISLTDIADQVFASGSMGQGIAIDPTIGVITAPADGRVNLLFPTKHAIGLVTADGAELLIHIGMDTVELKGEHFTAHIEQGDTVKAGQKLISFDVEAIREKGYSLVTPIIIANSAEYQRVLATDAKDVATQDSLIEVIK
ncbi:MAG: PTS glucose transporter subunit IIA [Enterococcus sp.]